MKGIKQTILLGIFFCILVSTYTSFSFIVTYMYEHKEDGLEIMGPILLAANNISFLIANSFAPSIRLTHKKQMQIAALSYTFNYIVQALQFPGAWGIGGSILGTTVGGCGAAILWVSYGSYMKNLCKIHKQEHLQGRYFAISNGISFGSLLLGPIITTFCLPLFSDEIYFIILSGIGFLSFLFCTFFIREVQRINNFSKQNCLPQLLKSFKFYKKMIAIIPALIFDGLVLGFVSTSSTKLMPKDSSKIQIGIFLIILGCGCILGGFLSGLLSDLINPQNAGKLSIMIVLVVSVITVLLKPFMNIFLAFICAFLWGIGRQFIQGWLYVACSINYNGRLESYANMKQLHAFAFCIYQAIAIITNLQLQTTYFMLVFILSSPICFYFLNKLPNPLTNKKLKQEIKSDYTISLESSSEQSN